MNDHQIAAEAVRRKRHGKVCIGCGHPVKNRVVSQSMGRYRLCAMCYATGGLLYKGDGIYYYMRPSGDVESAAKRMRSLNQLVAPGGRR